MLFEYIINSIETDGYDVEAETSEEKLQFVLKCFNSEFNHEYNRKLYPNIQTRFAEYLMGLPSCINIDFYYIDIENRLREFGIINPADSQKKIDGFVDRWFVVIAAKFLQLCNRYKIDYSLN